MKILVTGGAGFCGSHIVDAYLNLGHEVVVVDNFLTGKRSHLSQEVKLYQLDIRDESLMKIFEQENFEIVNHQAVQMDLRRSAHNPRFEVETNLAGTLNVLENCVRFGVQQFIFASDGTAIYGDPQYVPIDEEHPVQPTTPYGISKLTLENYLYYYKEIHDLNYFVLRYSNVYGPRQNPQANNGVVAVFLEELLRGSQPVIHGDGKQTRDFIYVKDLVRANVEALNHPSCERVNVGTGIETSVNQMYHRLLEITGNGDLGENHTETRIREQRRNVLSTDKAQKILRWQPEYTLAQGLAETIQYYRTHQTTRKGE